MPNKRKSAKKKSRGAKAKNENDLTLNDKMAIYLNEALAIENAAIPRLQSRIRETPLNDAKVQLRHHLEETREQQDRLKQLIQSLGSKPTSDKARLPVPESPRRLSNFVKRSSVPAELELRRAKEDAIIENAEVVMYDTLLQLAQQMSVSDALPVLTQNLSEEREMADWIRSNTPVIITQLYPKIESSVNHEQGERQETPRAAQA